MSDDRRFCRTIDHLEDSLLLSVDLNNSFYATEEKSMDKRKNGRIRNILGSTKKTTGQNLMEAIDEGIVYPIGIPSYLLGEAEKILRDALDDDQFKFVYYGFGFDRSKKGQDEEEDLDLRKNIALAEKFKTNPRYVSKVLSDAIEVLKGSPYRNQLRELVPTLDDLFRDVEKLNDVKSELELAKSKLQTLEESIEGRERAAKNAMRIALDKRDELWAENNSLRSDIAHLSSENDRLWVEVQKLQNELSEVYRKAELAEAAAGVATEVVKRYQEFNLEAVTAFAADIANIKISVSSLESLELSDEVAKKLKSCEIGDIDKLCTHTKRSLTKMFGQETADNIEEKLRKRGRFLKAAASL